MARLYLSPPYLTGREMELVQEAFDTNWIAPLGPHVDAFEGELAAAAGRAHATALSSGTAALHLAVRMLGIGAGDTVLVSSLTFSATANAIAYERAEPVFVDATPETWNLDPGLVAEELDRCGRAGRLPKAVIAVDLYGQCADYDPLLAACARWEVPLIEDAAEALGATYKGRPAGAFGVMAAFSFNGNKIITTSGGGMLAADDPGWTRRARHLATQARDPAPHYQHSEIGFNYRMSNVAAAIGRGQLATLAHRVARRREINAWYRRRFAEVPGIAFMPEAAYGESNCWLTCITVDAAAFGADREAIRKKLEADDIEARPVWKPMHLQPVFAGCRAVGGTVAEAIFRDGLCLPSGTAMSEADLERVAAGVLACGKY
ncbi:MAG TPA: aminotransferase class I/II-fold pyridoxal phosphate-dependent enzyme [Thermodesulfobacteriota bacterium]|nr:aminotransferase class I/II-fold pyridoxal phosphate-dependent enzyme [Thermodesulfobacteriota bacterium]HNU01154.1 aminotransferase class I/II-fold pyridoxal phosphate-dependent enzyme [Acidobacteriota bacterium]